MVEATDKNGPGPHSDDPVASAGDTPAACDATSRRIAIVGIPGSGKSALFQALAKGGPAGAAAEWGDLDERRAVLGGRPVQLIDTPGVATVEASVEDEAGALRWLRSDPPDLLIQCADTARLPRSLALTAELAALRIPMVLCLSMYDEAMEDGLVVDAAALANDLGLPVVPACATDGRGLRRLEASLDLARVPSRPGLPNDRPHACGRPHPAATRAGAAWVEHPCRRAGLQPDRRWQHGCRRWAAELAGRVTRRTGLEPKPRMGTWLGNWALHPLVAWLILAITLTAVYVLVAEVGASVLGTAMDRWIATPLCHAIGRRIDREPLRQFLVGDYGVLSLGLLNALCTVVPILLMFYLAYSFLEEMGYFPYLAAQLDKAMRAVGLTGKAVLPMTLGLGCNSVATLAAGRLETARQRFIASFLIALGVPCAVQLGVFLAILATVPLWALAIVAGALLVVQLAVGRGLAAILPGERRSDFLLQIPRLRRPSIARVLAKTRYQVQGFLREAVPLFVASAAALQALDWAGVLAYLRRALAPVVVTGLGLPEGFADTLLATLARREVGAVMMKELVDRGGLSTMQIVVGLTVMTLFVPCLNNTLILGRVVGWLRSAVIVIAIIAVALGTGALIHAVWH